MPSSRCPVLLAAAMALAGLSATARAADPPAPLITVTGEAEAEVPPDIAILSLGVTSEGRTAATATNDVATKAAAMMAVLRDGGIDLEDVRTAALSLTPLYQEDKDGRRTGTAPRAFEASTSYRVRVRPAERAGEIASKLVERGANTVDGISYDIADRAARLDALGAEAARDAKRKATITVEALGIHLGAVNEITPSGGGYEPPPAPMMAARAAKVAAIPAAPGLITLRATVAVRWLLAP